MIGQVSQRQVPTAAMERHMERVQQAIEGGNVIRPQEMYDPGLIHPYEGQPPSGPGVQSDLERVYAGLRRHTQPTCDAVAGSMKAEAATLGRQGTLFAVGAAVLAGGAVAAALMLPGAGAWVGAGVSAVAGAGSGVMAASRFRQASDATRTATLVEGWERNIRDPQGLWPIPAADSVPFPYVQYVENIMIGQRRRAVVS